MTRRPRPLVLVGLSGAGKTTAGRMAAGRLDVPFVDVDTLIEERAGLSIPRIFAEQGEGCFRVLEHEIVMGEIDGPGARVVSPGGGWAAQPGNLADLGDRGVTVYLRVSPGTAAARVAGGEERPLLTGRPAIETLRELLTEREPFYERCDAIVETDGIPVPVVVDRLVELARSRAGI